MRINVNDKNGRQFEELGLVPCVDFIGKVLQLRYLGDMHFAIVTDLGEFSARVEDSGNDVFSRAGFGRVLLPNANHREVLYFDIRLICAIFRVGLIVWQDGACHFCPKAHPAGTEILFPSASQAWCEVGEKYVIGLEGRMLNSLTSRVVHIDMDGNVLFRPDTCFQSLQYVKAEDRLIAILLRVSKVGPSMMNSGRLEAMIMQHREYYRHRVAGHLKLVQWMTEGEKEL